MYPLAIFCITVAVLVEVGCIVLFGAAARVYQLDGKNETISAFIPLEQMFVTDRLGEEVAYLISIYVMVAGLTYMLLSWIEYEEKDIVIQCFCGWFCIILFLILCLATDGQAFNNCTPISSTQGRRSRRV